MSNRAIRRHHRDRLKLRARKILSGRRFYSPFNPDTEEDIMYRVNRRWNNMHGCSCHMCCNERWTWGGEHKTLQELRELDRENDGWQELTQDT